MLIKFYNEFDNYFNNFLFNKFSLHKYTHSPHSHLPITCLPTSNSAALGAMYQNHPPGFDCTTKAAATVQILAHPANADTGATGTYIAKRDIHCVDNVSTCRPESKISVQVANGQAITSTHEGNLYTPDGSVMKAHIFPDISDSLLSVSQLVDLGFTAEYDSTGVKFSKNKSVIFKGIRDPISRLWMVDLAKLSRPIAPALPAPPVMTAVAAAFAVPAVRLQSKEEHVRYWHACFGFPSKSTFVYALTKWLTVPGLTAADVKKYLPNIVNTALGHLDATRKNIASTRGKRPAVADYSRPAIWLCDHEVAARLHLDAAGALPFTGRDGSRYLIIFFSEKCNYIHVVGIKSRSAAEYVRALKSALQFFSRHGVDTSFVRMDNECSAELKELVRTGSISLELTPASQHRRNKAERAIRSFKNHFIAANSGVDPTAPKDLWSDFCAQIEETLNLLRRGRSGKSAWEDLFGVRDFNAVPLAPIGIKVVAHVPPEKRASWAEHGLVGYYIGPAYEHYRCFRVWIPSTKAIRVSDCLEWFPADILSASMDQKLAALPLVPPTAEFQRVEVPVVSAESGRDQRVKPPLALPPVPAHTSKPADITSTFPEQLEHNKRRRSPGYYCPLTAAELNQLPKNVFRKIGQRFEDSEDPEDTTAGIVVDVVKHTKSNKLQFKVYDDQVFPDGPPTDKSDYSYLNVKWAMKSCRFQKAKKAISQLASLALQVSIEERQYNFGTTSPKRQKQRRQRQRPRLEWYQKLPLRANAAHQVPPAPGSSFWHEALSAIDLNPDGTRLTATSALNGPDRLAWLLKFGEEIERLIASGTGVFIRRADVPAGKIVAYYNPQLKYKMKNGELVMRVRGTIGGDQLPYTGPTAAQTAALEVMRLLLNALVSEGANLMTLDIKDFYLGTPLDEPEFMRIPLKFIPLELQTKYNLKAIQTHDCVIMRIEKSIYGLKQAGLLSQDRLVAHLAKHGYLQCHFTPCLFVHTTNGTAFTLVVDDFLVKYKDVAAGQHLIACLKELYEITVDMAPVQKYVGITIDYRKDKRYIDLSMPGYVQKALVRFGKTAVRGVNSPMTYVPRQVANSQTGCS